LTGNNAGNITACSEAADLSGRSAGNFARLLVDCGKVREIHTGKAGEGIRSRSRCTAGKVAWEYSGWGVGKGSERSVGQRIASGRQEECESSKEFTNRHGE
jgi:hypothetical protein